MCAAKCLYVSKKSLISAGPSWLQLAARVVLVVFCGMPVLKSLCPRCECGASLLGQAVGLCRKSFSDVAHFITCALWHFLPTEQKFRAISVAS